jgi:hypothetical protein
MDMADSTIDWELDEAIPLIQETLRTTPGKVHFRNARYVTHHAPTRLSLAGPRWYEHVPFISRVLTLLDHFAEIQVPR